MANREQILKWWKKQPLIERQNMAAIFKGDWPFEAVDRSTSTIECIHDALFPDIQIKMENKK